MKLKYLLLLLWSINLFGDSREYITSNGFKKNAKYQVLRSGINFDPKNIEPKSIIYVDGKFLRFFFDIIFPQITVPFVLVTHNADQASPGEFFEYLDDKRILRWYGANPDITGHPKFFPLPIGIPNRYEQNFDITHPKFSHIPMDILKRAVFDDVKTLDAVLARVNILDRTEKVHKLYMNFSLSSDIRAKRQSVPSRTQVYNHFINKPFVFNAERKQFEKYLLEMSQYLFVLSPFGGGLDCYRTWEALLVGSIPVVHSSTVNDLYKDLPVIIVEDWREVTEDFLEKKYLEIKGLPYNREKLFLQYWIEHINLYHDSLPLFLEKTNYDFLTNDQFLLYHVKNCITKTNEHTSKLTKEVLSINGMSSSKVRHFLNNVCSLEGAQYLEIGVYKGSTFIAGLYKNNNLIDPIAIDNWSEFGGKDVFKQYTNKFLSGNAFRVIDQNAFSINVHQLFYRPVNIYFYDGNHSYEAQYKAFTHYDKVFADTFIAIVDDWNWDQVRNGTRDAFKELGYTILFEEVLPAPYNGDKDNWWNGLYVAVIKKPARNNN